LPTTPKANSLAYQTVSAYFSQTVVCNIKIIINETINL